jgi:hypothetical protein
MVGLLVESTAGTYRVIGCRSVFHTRARHRRCEHSVGAADFLLCVREQKQVMPLPHTLSSSHSRSGEQAVALALHHGIALAGAGLEPG